MKQELYVFNDEEIEKLKIYRDNQPDIRLKIRFVALLFLAEGVPISTVASCNGKSKKTIEIWVKKYRSKGIEALNSFQYKPKASYLDQQQTNRVVQYVKENRPSIKEVHSYIEGNFQVDYTADTIRKMLKRNGLKLLKPKTIPGNAPDEKAQINFIWKYFTMKSMYPLGSVFLFGDAMHLIHQNVPGYCWGDPKNPPVNKTNSGRDRLNILGVYNPDTRSLLHLTGEKNCNAKRVIEFFSLIEKAYSDAPFIVIILDNATYFKARIVREWLFEHPQIHLVFLPTYCPNLNLIERFWGFAKEKLVRNKYYKKYKTFRARVFQFLNHVDIYVDELKTLMTEKFQIITA